MDWFSVGMVIAIAVPFGICLWQVLSVTVYLPWQDEELDRMRRTNRKVEAMAREQSRHDRAMSRIWSNPR